MKLATRSFRLLLLPFCCFLVAGCAHSYDAINAEQIGYRNVQETEDVEFSYRYDALKAVGNDNYASEADEESIYVVAVRVQNGTEQTLMLDRRTLRVTAGGVPVGLASTEPIVEEVQQLVWPYSLYGLLFLTISDGGDSVTLPIGAPIALFNIFRGVRANNQLEREFEEDVLVGQQVGPGETAYGLIYLRDTNLEPLEFSLEQPQQDAPAATRTDDAQQR